MASSLVGLTVHVLLEIVLHLFSVEKKNDLRWPLFLY